MSYRKTEADCQASRLREFSGMWTLDASGYEEGTDCCDRDHPSPASVRQILDTLLPTTVSSKLQMMEGQTW
ncbi:hypothetical protein RRG08_006909 [Elysia crispata]|uniref:Uncharacterized protein n=1 Tax=Elysia crispata TaxID=231223 RepID=A0AAE1EDC3_9GAST|nr:hypothetical protein RRG08_006909 [Elysia crispata]